MNTARLLGNSSNVIDWNRIIQDLLSQSAPTIGPVSGIGYKEDYVPEHIAKPDEFIKTKELWKQSGYTSSLDGGTAEWHMYYPGLNFDQSVVDTFINFFNIEAFNECWISMILPGKCAPWHVDQYIVSSNSSRYHCHVGYPEMGHIFMIDNEYYVNAPQGTAYQWNNMYSWHAGVNAGKTPKFLFNMC